MLWLLAAYEGNEGNAAACLTPLSGFDMFVPQFTAPGPLLPAQACCLEALASLLLTSPTLQPQAPDVAVMAAWLLEVSPSMYARLHGFRAAISFKPAGRDGY